MFKQSTALPIKPKTKFKKMLKINQIKLEKMYFNHFPITGVWFLAFGSKTSYQKKLADLNSLQVEL